MARRPKQDVTLIAVSKQQQAERIDASLANGHRVFGENRVQEAKTRWKERKVLYPDLSLHLIGPLQSNKTAEAVCLFDVIHTVDRPKIATAIAFEANKQQKQIECFIQVNTGEELQKSGIAPAELENFLAFCRMEAGLSVKGLMCIPPVLEEAAMHFALLSRKLDSLGWSYGALPAHDGLWSAAQDTAHDVAARLAIVPMVLEARGLDVTPATLARVRAQGDENGAKILERILDDEIRHVAAGSKHFHAICKMRAQNPQKTWQNLVGMHFAGGLKPPFNDSARFAGGLPRDYYAGIA